MKQDNAGSSIHDFLKRVQQLAAQSQYSELEIALAVSLCIRDKQVGLDEGFAIIETELKKQTAKGW